MKRFSFMSLNAIHTYLWVASILVVAVLSACTGGGESASAAGSWVPLTVIAEGQGATSVPASIVGIGTSLWLEPTDLSTGLDPERLYLAVGLLNRERVLDPREITAAVNSARLVRWPEGSVVPSEVEVEVSNLEPQLRNLGAHPTEASGTNRARAKVVPTEPLRPGWYALEGGPNGPISRFHVGSCPVVVGLSTCDGMDGVAVVFSELVSQDADVRVLLLGNGRTCQHNPQRFENRRQTRSMRRYFTCDVDATNEAVRVRVGDVTVRQGKKLALPAGIIEDGLSSLDIGPQNYTRVGTCSHARVPLSAPLPLCL